MPLEMVINVFTLNIWGIPIVSKDRDERVVAIVDKLISGNYDLVCLQEVWSDNDFLFLKERTSAVLPHAHYFYSGVFGSGVCIFSKYVIEDAFFHQWPLNGYVHKIHHGDWFGGKGVGLCKVRCIGININIYSAHLHAEYDRGFDEYLAHRVLQAFDMSQFIRLTSSDADLVILGGDLNTEPGHLSYRIIRYNAQLQDSFDEAQEKSEDCKGTSETCQNSYTDQKAARENPEGSRIDYVMYKPGTGFKVSCLNYKHPLPSQVSEKSFSFSDHEAVAASLSIIKSSNASGDAPSQDEEYIKTMKESVSICDAALRKLRQDKRSYWMYSSVLFLALFGTIGSDPYNFFKTGNFVRILFTLLLCYTVFMATVWNSIEVNAIITGKQGMEIIHSKLLHNKQNINVHVCSKGARGKLIPVCICVVPTFQETNKLLVTKDKDVEVYNYWRKMFYYFN